MGPSKAKLSQLAQVFNMVNFCTEKTRSCRLDNVRRNTHKYTRLGSYCSRASPWLSKEAQNTAHEEPNVAAYASRSRIRYCIQRKGRSSSAKSR